MRAAIVLMRTGRWGGRSVGAAAPVQRSHPPEDSKPRAGSCNLPLNGQVERSGPGRSPTSDAPLAVFIHSSRFFLSQEISYWFFHF